MYIVDETIIPVRPAGVQDVSSDREPMHPDDFRAHLAWVLAKRFQEGTVEKPLPEHVVSCSIRG